MDSGNQLTFKTFYDDNGNIVYEGNTYNGKAYGQGKVFWSNGNIYQEGEFGLKGLINGTEYYSNGQPRFKGTFSVNRAYGPNAPVEGEFYDTEGKLLFSGKFKVNYSGVGYPTVIEPEGFGPIPQDNCPGYPIYFYDDEKRLLNDQVMNNILSIANMLHNEALEANSYYLIMQQLRKLRAEYDSEIRISGAFFVNTYKAMLDACFMQIAKIYDSNKASLTVGKLLEKCIENSSLFPEYRECLVKEGGKEKIIYLPYKHKVKPNEVHFFEKKEHKFFNEKDIKENTNIAYSVVDLKFSELLALFQDNINSLNKILCCIREQRNKLFAHNNEIIINDLNGFLNRNPVSYNDIKTLIDFAFDCTELIIGRITDIQKARQYDNIDDLEGALKLIRLGLKYKKIEIEQFKQNQLQ